MERVSSKLAIGIDRVSERVLTPFFVYRCTFVKAAWGESRPRQVVRSPCAKQN